MQTPLKNNIFTNSNQLLIILLLSFFFVILLILLPGTRLRAQPEIERKQQLLDLQKKLDELNASLAKANKQEKIKVNENKKNSSSNKSDSKEDSNDNKNKESSKLKKDKEIKEELNQKNKIITPEKKKESGNAERNSEVKDNKNDDEEYKKEKKRADWILRTINNGTHKARKDAINRILSIKNAELKRQLDKKVIDIIHNEIDLEVKVKAITVAGELKSKDAVPYLTESLESESKDVIIAAVYAIKRIGDQSAKPVLIKKLKEQKLDANSNVIEALINTLGEFKAVELISFATDAIKDIKTDKIIRELLVLFLGKLESKESKDILVEILKDEDESVQIRAYAANSLANLRVNEAGVDIEKVINTIEGYPFNKKKRYYNLYIYCVAALAKLGDENAIPRLINALRSDNAVVRLKAVSLIKELKDKRTIDILKYKKDYDPSPKVQKAAKEALIELGVESEDSEDKGKEKDQ